MRLRVALCCFIVGAGTAWAEPSTETVEQTLCRLIDNAAIAHDIPSDFLTKLIWRESSFRAGVISPAGAQGIAQFMPGTAQERSLADPFDPEQAIPKAAELIADLNRRFGNLGLAAAAYNGGPARVASWLAGQGNLPFETRNYVMAVTDRSAEDWAADLREKEKAETGTSTPSEKARSCAELVATLRLPARDTPGESPFAPWGVQLAGNFSKARALAAFERASRAYVSLLGEVRPMVIGTRLLNRGTRTFYRVRIPAESRSAANRICTRIRSIGGSCVALPS